MCLNKVHSTSDVNSLRRLYDDVSSKILLGAIPTPTLTSLLDFIKLEVEA